MKKRSVRLRILVDMILQQCSTFFSLIGILILAWILIEVVIRGIDIISPHFFVQPTAPQAGAVGGIGNAILGSLFITALAGMFGIPIGILSGIYLSEFADSGLFATTVRMSVDYLIGTPSIIYGLFVYLIFVIPMRTFTGYAGALSLALILIPVVTNTTMEELRKVPMQIRQSALALGASRSFMIRTVVIGAARHGLLTGVVLVVARISGETAPLLFTALNSTYWPTELGQPTANLTVTVFNYALSANPDKQQTAWGASFTILVAVLLLHVIARFTTKEH